MNDTMRTPATIRAGAGGPRRPPHMRPTDAPLCQRFVMELSPKPFRQLDRAAVQATAEHLMTIWAPLAAHAADVAVLLWVGDGSEILDWHGNLDEPIAWAKYTGFCNYTEPGAYDAKVRHYRINQAVPYMRNPPVLRYRDLRLIIQCLRRAARRILGNPLRVGATIDPGPEFTDSGFKFRTHPEILTPDLMPSMPMRFITHQARLHADPRPYGGFPAGVPADTSLGTFLGRQFGTLRLALGFDYIWFSNGFGYSHYPWGPRGELFRGPTFDTARAAMQHEKSNAFWNDFRTACPDTAIEVRGTNYSVGMDLASDGCSHADIAAIGRLDRPPCNPPWGSRALGLEIVSYLSRIAKTRTSRLPFRFYLNDPWFVTNPWYDYYNREPFDLFVPLSLSRINNTGGVDAPSDVSLLTVNTESGDLPRDEALDVTPQLLRALAERADAAGPIVWVYPFDEYDAVLKRTPAELPHLFHQDWFFCQAVNAGFPACTVCSSDRFTALEQARKLPDAIYVAPVARGDAACQRALLRHVRRGGKVLLYGSLDGAPPALRNALGVTRAEAGLEGDFAAEVRLLTDHFVQPPRPPGTDGVAASLGLDAAVRQTALPAVKRRPLRHRAAVDGGGLSAGVADWADPAVRLVARRGRHKRAYAIHRARPAWHGGRLAWIWGSTGFDHTDTDVAEGRFDHPWEARRAAEWLRGLLAEMGFEIRQERHDESVPPACLIIKRHRGAWFFVGHKPNTSVRFAVRTPDGAPVYAESETPIRAGFAGESFHKTIYTEVRAFVQMPDGTVSSKELGRPIGKQRHFCIGGLVSARVVIYPDPQALTSGSLHVSRLIAGEESVPYRVDARRQAVTVSRYTGDLYVSW
ncbi:MAG: hypothetical protein K8T26_01005 [Lentisphaerae bacterium]|nr:hypothetical protein [Lentisphaerota bacterium]